MKEISSPYYPRRAQWHSRFRRLWFDWSRALGIESLRLPDGISKRSFLLSLVLPGYAFSALGRKMAGRGIGIGYGLVGLIFIAAIGHRIAGLSLGLMLSAHVTSLAFLAGHWNPAAGLRMRMATCLTAMVALQILVYSPLQGWVEKRWAMPLRIGDRVVVVKPGGKPGSVRAGDVVAYRIPGFQVHGLYVREGIGLEPVLAVGGDHVRFQSHRLEVNGKVLKRQPHMPPAGEVFVPEKHWFIWPTLSIVNRNNQAETNIAAALLHTAMIAETGYIGKPYRHWFGRSQSPP